MGKFGWYVFLLLLVLIVVAYYKGAKAVGGTLFAGGTSLSYALSGRNRQGNFAAYPAG